MELFNSPNQQPLKHEPPPAKKIFKCYKCKLEYNKCDCYYKCPVCDCIEFVAVECVNCKKKTMSNKHPIDNSLFTEDL